MNKNFVLLVTHGETIPYANGVLYPDPGMTPGGLAKIAALAPKVKEILDGREPAEVHCGTGRRHQEVVDVLGYGGGRVVYYSDVLGGAATFVQRSENEGKLILLGTGVLVPDKHYLSTKHLGNAIRQAIVSMPSRSVVCAGRATLRRLLVPKEDWYNGALYVIYCLPGNINSIECQQLTGGIKL